MVLNRGVGVVGVARRRLLMVDAVDVSPRRRLHHRRQRLSRTLQRHRSLRGRWKGYDAS